MAGDKLVRRIAIAVLAPAFGEHVFLVPFEHREPSDTVQVARTGFLACRRRLSPVWTRSGIGFNKINAHGAI
jgi:hypothetical protein